LPPSPLNTPSPQTLYAKTGDFKAYKALVAAKYNGVEVKTVYLEESALSSNAVVKASAMGKVPLLVTPGGSIAESNAIARYLGRIRRDTELSGRTYFESAQVDSWLDYCVTDLEVPATLVTYPIFGWLEDRPEVTAGAYANLHASLATLEAHLLPRTYLVGEAVTLADVACACALVNVFKVALGAGDRAAYPSVLRWFLTIANQPQVAAVVGPVELCEVALGAGSAPAPKAAAAAAKGEKKAKEPKAEAAAAAPKEEKKKDKKKKDEDEDDDGGEDAAEAALRAEPKKVDPFSGLAPSAFVGDEWKRTYSNSKEDFRKVMPWFWEHLDRAGWSVWSQNYKYNADNKVDWMVSNTVGGFLQRCDEVRKYAFGMMAVLGDAAPYEIMGVWLIRGKSMGPMLEANPDAEYYDWKELDVESAEVRKMVEDVWCHNYPGSLLGKTIYDSKVSGVNCALRVPALPPLPHSPP
jgi:elongation factor 1-gamma